MGRRLEDVPVVMDLHELAPVSGWATGGRHRWRFERFDDAIGSRAAIGLGLGMFAVINPAYLFFLFLLLFAPLQGLAALLGGRGFVDRLEIRWNPQ